MILTKQEILKLVRAKKIEIKPFNENNIGMASIDLTLSNEFASLKNKTINTKGFDNDNIFLRQYNALLKKIKAKKIILKPGGFILSITKERIKLPLNICGFLCGRSRYARIGILVHATAPFVQPGVNNRQIFEIKNVSQNKIILNSGAKIGQLILFKTSKNTKYKGIFEKQLTL